MESQIIEWKESWRDEHLKWICAFANTQGGTLIIGKNDKGNIVGLGNTEKLLEDIPNKIRNALGIVPSVNLLNENGKYYISIGIASYDYPVSYHGKFYIRSGSTTQELGGNELTNFVLRKYGKTWDSITEPQVSVSQLDTTAFRKFREKALAAERLKKVDLEINDGTLLDSLMLTEGGNLTRAAILLFHDNPERYVFGAFVKVGYFDNDADLRYQDEVHGPLITMADRVVEIIYQKYFKGIISYEGLQRIEDFPVPRPAMREAVLNAIVHRDYTTGIPIQIKIFKDRVIIYNDGRLPENWTISDLLSTHRSRPHNPKIANTFFRSGMIETWGRGIERITTTCKDAGKREPLFEASSSEIKVTFFTDANIGENIGDSIGVNETAQKIIELMRKTPTISAKAIAAEIGIARRNVETNISVLKKAGFVERIGPAKGGHWVVQLTK
ncbi:MAG: putative DNA binding domain-containing protein [Clostridiales Family XIII bacterium]|nr:putative DNA binding domain-containing protein [Clostridiales Family XIII bacterium]